MIFVNKREERKEIEEIKEREKRLLEESKDDFEEDPLDKYITTRVKAQLVWTYLETKKKMDQMQKNIVKARQEVKDMDTENPDFILKYKEKHYAARNKAGLKEENDESFMKYLGDDIDDEKLLGF